MEILGAEGDEEGHIRHKKLIFTSKLRILICRHMCIICGDLVSNIAVMVVEGGLPGVFTLECKQSRGFYQELHHLTFCQESTLTKLSLLHSGFTVFQILFGGLERELMTR